MQRAAASTASPTSTSKNSDGHASKRRRTGDYTSTSAPQTPGSGTSTPRASDQHAISAALAAEEQARNQALAKLGNAGGETQWVLNIPGITDSTNRTTNGHGTKTTDPDYSDSDSAPDISSDEDDDIVIGRQAYGDFKRRNKASTKPTSDPEPNVTDDDDDEDDEEDGETSSSLSSQEDEAEAEAEEPPNPYAPSRTASKNKKANDNSLKKRQRDYEASTQDSIKSWSGSGQISGSGGRPKVSPGGGGGGGSLRKKFSKAFSGFGGGRGHSAGKKRSRQ